jgi:hypothetical protein
MRVTDGSSAANPVIGVNVTFATTLVRVNPNGTSVILGSSQTQVTTAQDGTASIVPSGGNVGPCTVFVTVNAGQSTTQLQMEVVAALETEAPVKTEHQSPPEPSAPHFGGKMPASQEVPQEFFAVPEAAPSSAAPTDDCSGGNASSACETQPNSAESSGPDITAPVAVADDTQKSGGDLPSAPPISPGNPSALSPVAAPARMPVPPVPGPEDRPKAIAPVPAPKPDAASLIEDKRSCRFAQTEAVLVW